MGPSGAFDWKQQQQQQQSMRASHGSRTAKHGTTRHNLLGKQHPAGTLVRVCPLITDACHTDRNSSRTALTLVCRHWYPRLSLGAPPLLLLGLQNPRQHALTTHRYRSCLLRASKNSTLLQPFSSATSLITPLNDTQDTTDSKHHI